MRTLLVVDAASAYRQRGRSARPAEPRGARLYPGGGAAHAGAVAGDAGHRRAARPGLQSRAAEPAVCVRCRQAGHSPCERGGRAGVSARDEPAADAATAAGEPEEAGATAAATVGEPEDVFHTLLRVR